MRIAIDFDGTIVKGDNYPNIGELALNAKTVINKLFNEGHKILINSCRTGKYEGMIEDFLKENDIHYHYINCNQPEDIYKYKQDCRKISADVYIDDNNLLGIPNDWNDIYNIIQLMKIKYEI
jgi:hypothetical protein